MATYIARPDMNYTVYLSMLPIVIREIVCTYIYEIVEINIKKRKRLVDYNKIYLYNIVIHNKNINYMYNNIIYNFIGGTFTFVKNYQIGKYYNFIFEDNEKLNDIINYIKKLFMQIYNVKIADHDVLFKMDYERLSFENLHNGVYTPSRTLFFKRDFKTVVTLVNDELCINNDVGNKIEIDKYFVKGNKYAIAFKIKILNNCLRFTMFQVVKSSK